MNTGHCGAHTRESGGIGEEQPRTGFFFFAAAIAAGEADDDSFDFFGAAFPVSADELEASARRFFPRAMI